MDVPEQRKICFITGATSGIGKAASLEIARRGMQVVIAGRDRGKCEKTVAHIREQTGQPVDYLLADLSSMEQVRRMARQYRENYGRIDVLVNNAGAFFIRRQESVDGIEMTFAVNHLSYFLLTLLMLDMLKAVPAGRVVNVASDSHRGQKLDFADLQLKKHYNGYRAYGYSKLANVLFTYELARRLEGSRVTANALHPGFVDTGIWGESLTWARILVRPIVRRIALTPEEGAQTVVYLATAEEVEGITGKYFTKKKPVRSDPASYDEETARRLWDLSLELVGPID